MKISQNDDNESLSGTNYNAWVKSYPLDKIQSIEFSLTVAQKLLWIYISVQVKYKNYNSISEVQ